VLDVFIDTQSINIDEKISYINEENIIDVYLDYVTPTLLKLKIRGIDGITNCFHFKGEDDNWYIETKGSNFPEVLALSYVDTSRTMTNNIWEIYNTLGVEAVRQYLVKEFTNVVSDVNLCHLKLLSDKMTFNGKIDPISRYSIRSENSGALSKSSFEEPLDNIIKSCINSEVEYTNSVSTSIMCARMAPVGTGLVDLHLDIEKLIELGEEERVFKGDVCENLFE
jgi:DNA-directed RNA polymerase beta' subunit